MPLNATEKKRKRQELAAVEAIARVSRAASEGTVVTSERGRQAEEELRAVVNFPTVVVFDLDDTLWVGDIDLTSGPPFKQDGRGLPVVAQKGGHGDKVVPFPDVPEVFDWLELQGIKVAVCTHGYKPAWSAEVFNLLETASGTKYSDLLALPIGNEVCKKTKDVHLKALAAKLECACDDMVFFDDKAHNVTDGRKAGATSCVTESGLTWDAFVQCLRQFEQKKTGNAESPEVALQSTISAPVISTPAAPKSGIPRPAVPKFAAPRPRFQGAAPSEWSWTEPNQAAYGSTSNQSAWAAYGSATFGPEAVFFPPWMVRPNRAAYGCGPYSQ